MDYTDKSPVLDAACYIMNYVVKLDLPSTKPIYKSVYHSVCLDIFSLVLLQ